MGCCGLGTTKIVVHPNRSYQASDRDQVPDFSSKLATELSATGKPGRSLAQVNRQLPCTEVAPAPSNFLQRSFYPLLGRAGLPRIRCHDLRHSAATLLLGLGIHPKIVS
jgi:hypothetical protein